MQQLFNRAVTAILAQGRGSFTLDEDGDPTCLYRGPEGTKCAVGHLITDEHYDQTLENSSLGSFEVRAAVALSNPTLGLEPAEEFTEYWRLLDRVQSAHDVACQPHVPDFTAKFLARVKVIAREFKLEMPDAAAV